MIDNQICKNYIQSPKGINLASIITELQAEAERLRLIESRRLELTTAMEAAGLQNILYNAGYEAYINRGTGSVEDVISQMRRQQEERRNQEARRLELTAAMEAAGIQNPPYNADYHSYINSGTSSVEDVISQIRRQEEVGRTQDARRQELTRKLAAAGLTLRSDSRLCQQYISSATGDADSIVDTMKEMDWFFRCTNYATSRKFYYSNADSDYDTDDDDDYYNEYGRGGWWLNDHGWREPRNRYHIDSERGKDLALQAWLTNRFKRRLYQSVEHDENDPSRPPTCLWPTINEKWQTALQMHAVRKLVPHYRTYHQTMTPVAGEMLVSETQVTDWLDQPEGAIGIPLSSLLSRIVGENWHQKLIARARSI
jgi:hypothetical protein